MTRPSSGNVNEDVWPSIAPAVPDDASYGDAAGIFVAAVCSPAELIDGYVRDTDDGIGWSALLDPARCPDEALPWLAQLAGVVLTGGQTPAQQRAMIQRRPGLDRGTRSALIDAVKATLTGTQFVGVNEQTGPSGTNAYHLTVYTLDSETPDPTATQAAAQSQTPAGILLYYSHPTGVTWDTTSHTWDGVAAGATWDTADSYSI